MKLGLSTLFGYAQISGSQPLDAVPGESATQGVSPALGQPGGPLGACGGQAGMMNFGLIAMMFAIFYFLLIRPQQKKQKEHAKMLSELKKGDQVVTGGGLIGTISGSTDKTFVVEVSEKVRVRVLRSQVLDKYTETETKKTDK